jgi:hypothetical protein
MQCKGNIEHIDIKEKPPAWIAKTSKPLIHLNMTFLRYLYEKYSPLYTLKKKDNFSKRKKQENKGKK